MDLIAKDFVQHYIFRAAKKVFLNLRIGLFELRDQVLGLKSFGTDITGLSFQSVLLREFASALQKAQTVVIAPGLDIFFTDQIHGPDQFHALKVGAAELRHHSLILA